jgi:LAO/AO transport system kinase
MQQLVGALSIRATISDKIPVLKTTATSGEGVPRLLEEIEAVGNRVRAKGAEARRRRRARYLIARAAADLVAARIRQGEGHHLDDLSDRVLAGTLTPDAAAAALLKD